MNPLVYLKEKPWDNLGHQYNSILTNSEEIITEAKLNWTVNSEDMYSESHGVINGYYTVFREDNSDLLGIVKTGKLAHVQNVDMFLCLEKLMNDGTITLETTGALSKSKIFGIFKSSEEISILGDDFNQYFIVINDHLRPDGKITVYNTPFRVVCLNQVDACLAKNYYAARIPVFDNQYQNIEAGAKIIESGLQATQYLRSKADKLAKIKISNDKLLDIVDELFPMPISHDEFGNLKGSEAVEMTRETFLNDCLGAANLSDFRGTAWGVYNACADFDSHYFKNVDNMYDLKYRMSKLSGLATEKGKAAKFLAVLPALVA